MIYKISSTKANQMIRLFLFVTILLLHNQIHARYQINPDLLKAYDQFLDFELDSCAYSLQAMNRTPMSFYLGSLLSSARIFINDDPLEYKMKKKVEDDWLKSSRESNFDRQAYNFLRSEIKLQWAIIKLKNREEFSAFWNLKQAYNIASENIERFPDFLPSYKTIGLLHIIFGILPDKYDWLLYLFGVEGNVDLGLSELNRVSSSNHFLRLEATISISLLQTYLLNNPAISIKTLDKIYSKNKHLLVDYAYSLVLMKNSQSERAFHIMKGTLETFNKPLRIAECYYLLGEINLQKDEPKLALEFYSQFLDLHQGQNLVKDAYYKIGICHWVRGSTAEAKKYFEKSRNIEWAMNEADKNAQKSLESEPSKIIELIKARYAIDGGFYNNATALLESIDESSLTQMERCEYYYRTARLHHKQDLTHKAIAWYLETIEEQGDNNWYFAPNSALQLGLLFISGSKNEKAKKYLKSINSYHNYPYQNSIRRKAKIELKKLD